MPVFDYSFEVRAPLEAVQAFHASTSALRRLTPPPLIVQLHSIEPLSEGSTSKFTLWMGPFPIRWTAVHRGVSDNGFTDVQTEGPARKWEHTHTFTEVGASLTRIDEHVEFEHGSGLVGWFTRFMFAHANLWILFTYRKLATRRALR